MASTTSQLIDQWRASDIPGTTGITRVLEAHGRKRSKFARFTTDVSQTTAHIYRLCRLRAHDSITSIKWLGTADAGLTDMDIGVRTPAVTSDADDDPAQIAAGQDSGLAEAITTIDGGSATPAEVLGFGKTLGALMGKPLWEQVGIADEPTHGTEYEVVLICSGAADPAGSGVYSFEIEYLAGD